jgi:hypothetical protein
MQHVYQPVMAILDNSLGFLRGVGGNNLHEKIKSSNLNQGFCRLQREFNSFTAEEGNSKILQSISNAYHISNMLNSLRLYL